MKKLFELKEDLQGWKDSLKIREINERKDRMAYASMLGEFKNMKANLRQQIRIYERNLLVVRRQHNRDKREIAEARRNIRKLEQKIKLHPYQTRTWTKKNFGKVWDSMEIAASSSEEVK